MVRTVAGSLDGDLCRQAKPSKAAFSELNYVSKNITHMHLRITEKKEPIEEFSQKSGGFVGAARVTWLLSLSWPPGETLVGNK